MEHSQVLVSGVSSFWSQRSACCRGLPLNKRQKDKTLEHRDPVLLWLLTAVLRSAFPLCVPQFPYLQQNSSLKKKVYIYFWVFLKYLGSAEILIPVI